MSLVSSSGARLDSSATATAEVESALPLLTFLLQQYGAQPRNALVQPPPQRRVAAVTLESLWVNMEHEWRFAIQAFIEGVKSSQLTTEVRLSFQSALSSLVLLVVVARHLLGLHRVSWVHAAESLVFGDLFPSIMGAFSSVHDPTWDEFYAGLLPVLGAVASTASSQTCRRSSNNSDATAQQTTTGGSGDAMEWCKSVLLSCEADVPLLCRNIALLLSIALEVDLTVTSSLHVEGDTVQHAFTAVFLQCANMLSDPALTKLLMRAVEKGSIRGDRLYATDLDVLLCILQRYATQQQQPAPSQDDGANVVSSSDAPSDWISLCEALLLSDIAPPKSATVTEVNEWLRRLCLEGDYQSVVRRQGIDGEVLWSDLTLEDVVEMGIYSRRDAKKLLTILSARR